MHPTPQGQQFAPERLTFAYFARQLQHYLHLEKGLPHTFVDLLRRPGPTLRGYFDGTGRAGYTNPVAYTLMAAAASLLAFGLYREAFAAWMQGRMGELPAIPSIPAGFMQHYGQNMMAVTQLTALNSVGLAVPQALLLWLLFRSPRFNLAEAFALALYGVGTFLFVHALLVGPFLYATEAWDVGSWVSPVLQTAVALRLGLGLFGARMRTALKLLVAVVSGFLVWTVGLTIIVAIYTAMQG